MAWAAMTVTEAAAPATGHPVRGSMVWAWRTPSCSKLCQRSPEVATAASSSASTRGGRASAAASSSGVDSTSTRHCVPSGLRPYARISPPTSTRAAGTPERRRCMAATSAPYPLAMPDRSSCRPPGWSRAQSPSRRCRCCQPVRRRSRSMSPAAGTWRRLPALPKPHRSTRGPMVGSNAPPLARAMAIAQSSTAANPAGSRCQLPAGARR